MSTYKGIPFLDLVTPHIELERDLTDVFEKALRTASFIGGSMVEEFEEAFANFCATERAVGVGNGTDALRFALMACGVRNGDVVVTVPHTFIATTEAISQARALPEFVDIDERTYNMDSLLAYSAVCAGGLDTVPLPGDITEDRVARILGDVATLAFKWKKPLAARLLPVPGKKAGDRTEFSDSRMANTVIQ